MRESELRQMYEIADGLNPNAYFFVDYRLRLEKAREIRDVAAEIALLTGLGSLAPLPKEDAGSRMAALPRVCLAERHGMECRVRLAYPRELLGRELNIPLLLTACWYPVEYHIADALWMVDVVLPQDVVAQCHGPRYGVSGLRDLLGVYNRPLLAMNLKPRLGMAIDRMEGYVRDAVEAGVDIVFDDELVVDQTGPWSFKKRVPKMMAAVRAGYEKRPYKERVTGEAQAIFVPNVTGQLRQMKTYARVVNEYELPIVLTNVFTVGFGVLMDMDVIGLENKVIVSAGIGSGMLSHTGSAVGCSDAVMAKLTRLGGADAVYAGLSSSDLWYTPEVVQASISALRSPMGLHRPSIPVVSGGLNIARLPDLLPVLGDDVILLCGNGLLRYPGGPGRGARDMRKLITELGQCGSVAEAREAAKELGSKNKEIHEGLHFFDPKY